MSSRRRAAPRQLVDPSGDCREAAGTHTGTEHRSTRWRELVAPAVALLPVLALVLWTLPEALPRWRAVAAASAWAGAGLLVTSLVLMVREPHLARFLGGLERAYRWHHRAGVLAYVFLLAHPLALAIDGWAESPHVAWETLAPWMQSWPVWLGWGGLLLTMAGLSATFAVRLSYRRWRGWHLVLGLAVLLGLGHVGVLLAETGPFLVVLVPGLVALGWRSIAGDLGAAARPYRVTAVSHPAIGMIEASLVPCAAALAVAPGQFVLAAFGEGPHYHGCGEYHPFTVSAVDREGRLRVAVKALGPCSARLQALEPGVFLRLQGPFGDFLDGTDRVPQLWIAGGIGITPFVAALRAGPRAAPTTLLYLHRNAADAAFADELARLASDDPRLELVAEAAGERPPDVGALLGKVRELSGREVRLCGPPAMVDAFLSRLREHGVPRDSIHFERFDFR